MTWFYLALGAAILGAAEDAAAKAVLRVASPWVVAWAPFLFGAPLLFLLLPGSESVVPGSRFYLATTVAVPLEMLAVILYVFAIQRSPLSLTVPFLSLTPVFTLPISYLLINELPGLLGVAGVVLVGVGAYVLNIQALDTGWLGPIRAIGREPGSAMMIGVALIFSVTSTLGKIAVVNSSPVFFGAVYSALLAVTMGVLAALKSPRVWSAVRVQIGPLILIGALYGGMALCHYKAIALAPVAYMIAIKRMSVLFAVIMGRVFFKEGNLRERFLGASIMVAGAVLITLG